MRTMSSINTLALSIWKVKYYGKMSTHEEFALWCQLRKDNLALNMSLDKLSAKSTSKMGVKMFLFVKGSLLVWLLYLTYRI